MNDSEKRLEMVKQSWIKNVMKVLNKSEKEALELYNKIQPKIKLIEER